MTAPHLQGPPRSTVGAAMVAIRDVLTDAGYARGNTNPGGVEILIGERYLREEGAPPRLVMVRGTGRAGLVQTGGPQRINDGNVAAWSQGFTCYLWGAEAIDDAARYDAQDALADQVTNAVRARLPGRCEVTTVNPLVDTNVITYGEELQLLVTYTRPVPRDATIRAVAVTPRSTLDPMRPNGDTGQTFTLDATASGTR